MEKKVGLTISVPENRFQELHDSYYSGKEIVGVVALKNGETAIISGIEEYASIYILEKDVIWEDSNSPCGTTGWFCSIGNEKLGYVSSSRKYAYGGQEMPKGVHNVFSAHIGGGNCIFAKNSLAYRGCGDTWVSSMEAMWLWEAVVGF